MSSDVEGRKGLAKRVRRRHFDAYLARILQEFDAYLARILQDRRLSCKILAYPTAILQDLARILQDLARFLQDLAR